MKQSSKRLASIFFSLLFLVVAFIVFFDLIEPAYANLQTLKGTAVSTQMFYTQEQAAVANAKTILGQYQSDTQAESSLALAMPSGPDVAGALAQIYGIGSANGIAITNVAIQAPTVQLQQTPAISNTPEDLTPAQIVKPLGTLSFQLTGSGSYEALTAFLSGLETNIRIFDVTALSLQPSANSFTGKGVNPNGDLFNYNVTVVTYYQLP